MQCLVLMLYAHAMLCPFAHFPCQVRNLRPCLKVAADFVSPEGAVQCAIMSELLRKRFQEAVSNGGGGRGAVR